MSTVTHTTQNTESALFLSTPLITQLNYGTSQSHILESTTAEKTKTDSNSSKTLQCGAPEISAFHPASSKDGYSTLTPRKVLNENIIHNPLAIYPKPVILDRFESPHDSALKFSSSSPFIPFCREKLSPLVSNNAQFTSSTSNRLLFTPK